MEGMTKRTRKGGARKAAKEDKWIEAIRARGGSISKPGTWLLEQLREWLSNHADAPLYAHVQPAVREGARYAQTAIDHISAGDAERAVLYAFLAQEVVGHVETHAAVIDKYETMRELAAWWESATKPAVEHERKRIEGKIKQRQNTKRKAEEAIEYALELMDAHSGRKGLSKTAAQKKAANMNLEH